MCLMPKADPLMVSVFREIGLANSSGMQLTPISFSELDAYCNRMKTDLTPWESITLIGMSRQYVNYLNKGTDKNCQSPWNDRSDEAIKANDDAVAAKMKALRGRKNKP